MRGICRAWPLVEERSSRSAWASCFFVAGALALGAVAGCSSKLNASQRCRINKLIEERIAEIEKVGPTSMGTRSAMDWANAISAAVNSDFEEILDVIYAQEFPDRAEGESIQLGELPRGLRSLVKSVMKIRLKFTGSVARIMLEEFDRRDAESGRESSGPLQQVRDVGLETLRELKRSINQL